RSRLRACVQVMAVKAWVRLSMIRHGSGSRSPPRGGTSAGRRQPARDALTRAGTAVHKAGPMRALLVTLGHLLASGRGRYGVLLAAAIGVAVWVVWLISLLARPGLLDLAGNVKGTDFLEFYAAGRIVAAHQTEHLYDLD